MKQQNSISLPKLKSRSHHFQKDYSNQFRNIFNYALDSVQKKRLKKNKSRYQSNNSVRQQTRILKTSLDTHKLSYDNYSIPTVSFISKVLKASRQDDTLTRQKPMLMNTITHKLDRNNKSQNKLNLRRPLAKLEMTRKPIKIFFQIPYKNPQQKFIIEPWLDQDTQ